MSTETEILSEVEALRARFSDTKALYREVCDLVNDINVERKVIVSPGSIKLKALLYSGSE